MIPRLIKSKNTFVKFGLYIKDVIDISVFIKLPFRHQFGTLLQFINNEGYNLVVDEFNYIIYDKMKGIKILESNNEDETPRDILEVYKDAIEATFTHIEQPF